MSGARKLAIHLAILAASVIAAVAVWTRDHEDPKRAATDVEVWDGRPEQIEHLEYRGDKRSVVLDAKRDDYGTWFEGTATRQTTPPPKPDAGSSTPQPETTTTHVVSVKAAEQISGKLAPLMAVRNLGVIAPDRAKEFGLDEPGATLLVRIGGTEHKLDIGNPAPGGRDRYVRRASTGEVFAIDASVTRDLDSGEATLNERELHGFTDDEVKKARVIVGDKSRDLVTGGDGPKRFWASPDTPAQSDETATNWMGKVNRLRPRAFEPSPPQGAKLVLRVELMDDSKTIGFFELFEIPGGGGDKGQADDKGGEDDKSEYTIRTERTRLHASVYRTIAEQVAHDVASVIGQ